MGHNEQYRELYGLQKAQLENQQPLCPPFREGWAHICRCVRSPLLYRCLKSRKWTFHGLIFPLPYRIYYPVHILNAYTQNLLFSPSYSPVTLLLFSCQCFLPHLYTPCPYAAAFFQLFHHVFCWELAACAAVYCETHSSV